MKPSSHFSLGIVLLLVCLLGPTNTAAQNAASGGGSATVQSYDLARFTPPAGWQRSVSPNSSVMYSRVDQNQGWCQLIVYNSLATSGSLEQDFRAEWQAVAVRKLSASGPANVADIPAANGWKCRSATGTFTHGGQPGTLLFQTFSGNGKRLTSIGLTNQNSYVPTIQKFLRSVTLAGPSSTEPVAALPPSRPPAPAARSAFQFTSSNFDDGWTASVQADWVLVQRETTRVYLYFYFPVGADMRPPNGNIRDNLWHRFVKPRYTVVSENENRKTMIHEWKEGEAVDRQTGERVYLAMVWDGNFYLAASPDRDTSCRLFPSPDALIAMSRYNKFALAASDIVGTWQSGGSTTTQWYDSVTGLAAGVTMAASGAVFTFNRDGSYASVHSGASGAVVGGMSTFQQEFRGRYTVTNWQLTATNRYQGRTDTFAAHFQAVRNGRLLHLNDNRGGSYLLVKVR